MNHPWTDKLSDYVDDELSVSDREMLEAHIATCDDCRETVAELRRVMEQILPG